MKKVLTALMEWTLLAAFVFVFGLTITSILHAQPYTTKGSGHLVTPSSFGALDVQPVICLDAAGVTVTCIASALPVSNTAQAWVTNADLPMNLTTAAGANVPCLVILGHNGSCTDLLWTLTTSSSAPSSYQYVSASAMPYPLPGIWGAGTILHVKAVSSSCTGSVIVAKIQ